MLLGVVPDATNRATRKTKVSLPGDVYRAITWTAVPDQGDVQRLSHPTCPSVKNISIDPGMREAIRDFTQGTPELLVAMDSHGGDLLAGASRKATMLLDDMC